MIQNRRSQLVMVVLTVVVATAGLLVLQTPSYAKDIRLYGYAYVKPSIIPLHPAGITKVVISGAGRQWVASLNWLGRWDNVWVPEGKAYTVTAYCNLGHKDQVSIQLPSYSIWKPWTGKWEVNIAVH